MMCGISVINKNYSVLTCHPSICHISSKRYCRQ